MTAICGRTITLWNRQSSLSYQSINHELFISGERARLQLAAVGHQYLLLSPLPHRNPLTWDKHIRTLPRTGGSGWVSSKAELSKTKPRWKFCQINGCASKCFPTGKCDTFSEPHCHTGQGDDGDPSSLCNHLDWFPDQQEQEPPATLRNDRSNDCLHHSECTPGITARTASFRPSAGLHWNITQEQASKVLLHCVINSFLRLQLSVRLRGDNDLHTGTLQPHSLINHKHLTLMPERRLKQDQHRSSQGGSLYKAFSQRRSTEGQVTLKGLFRCSF